MRNSHHCGVIRVNATPFEAACPLHDPKMLPQLLAIQIDSELLRPKCKKGGKAIDAASWIAIMPAINQSQCLRMPIPVTPRMYYCVHGLLHLVEVMHLIEQWLMIHSSNMWIERTEQDRNLWSYSMH